MLIREYLLWYRNIFSDISEWHLKMEYENGIESEKKSGFDFRELTEGILNSFLKDFEGKKEFSWK